MAQPRVVAGMSGDRGDLREAWNRFYRSSAEPAIRELLEAYPQERSLEVDVLDLYEFDESFTRGLFSHPDRYLTAGADALRALNDTFNRVNVRLTNHPGLLGIGSLRARHVSELVTVEGVVGAVDPVQATASTGGFGCDRCGHRVERRARRRVETPTRCGECGAVDSFRLDFDRSTFVDVQRLELEAVAENQRGDAPGPSSDTVIDDDLVGSVSAGDRLLVTGVLRLEGQGRSGRFDFYLEANAIDEEPGEAPREPGDVSNELQEAIQSRWELLTDL